MTKLLPLIAVLALSLISAATGQEANALDTEIERVEKMTLPELNDFVGLVTATVGKDTLGLQRSAQRRDCLELTRAANSFALGYQLLGAGNDTLAGKPARDTLPVKVRIVQARVLTFAARVRAEEWLTRGCASFVTPADKAEDRRYAKPVRITNAEFTHAVIEAREAAEANLANAVAAGISQKCPQVISAAQSIQLFTPYLNKLISDVSKRPAALGPRASKRGLETVRNQLNAALRKLDTEFGQKCANGGKPAAETAPAPSAEPVPEPAVEPTPAPAQ